MKKSEALRYVMMQIEKEIRMKKAMCKLYKGDANAQRSLKVKINHREKVLKALKSK